MRLTTLFISLATVFFVSVTSAPAPAPLLLDLDLPGLLGISDFSPATHYNAPLAPWHPGSKPGWYFGQHPEKHPKLFCLGGLICKLLELLPKKFHCPKFPPHPPTTPPTTPPADGYTPTFSNLMGATQAGDYLTFGLVDTIADCKAMCNSVEGCKFINTYHDVNGKDGSTQLTCSLFSGCHDATSATNVGGQTQPDGSLNYIKESDGYCKA
ncbi:hypothetical protein D9611_000909 [Ephemerocybe angulata]|uniref:Fruit-body specific protein a n=1 Tax=Ephemerocybe angulata TaxID=980116 RepID=A0A8H5BPN6_9AGAR|nr:hypothetical protein D9611_000909 [Tulosesus angulatus]